MTCDASCPPAHLPPWAASFLIPAGVVIYTAVGGLKGTVVAEWLNVCVIYIALLIFMLQVGSGVVRRGAGLEGRAVCGGGRRGGTVHRGPLHGGMRRDAGW